MAEAERLLSGRTRHIRLGGKIESAYRDRSWRQNRKIIRAWMFWVVLIDALTLALNVLLLPRDVTMALLGPAAIIPLAATGVFLAWRKRRSDAVLEWSLNRGMFFILLAVKTGASPPISVGAFAPAAADYINPLPHTLMLTAIVVSVSTTGVALALLVRIHRRYGTLNERELHRKLRT